MSSGQVIVAQGLDVQVAHTRLLHGLCFQIAAGERVALVGHNGAGKSSLLKAMAGFVPVTGGQLRVLGCDMADRPRRQGLRRLRRQVAQVHQGLHLVDRLSVLDNVLIGAAARQASPLTWLGHWPKPERAAAHDALARVGMGWAAPRRTDSLSGGERQKVAIARALLQSAAPQTAASTERGFGSQVLLLADEPTASLDQDAAADVLSLLAEVASERRATLLCVLHDLQAVPRLAQRALVLRQGMLVADVAVTPASPQELRRWLT